MQETLVALVDCRVLFGAAQSGKNSTYLAMFDMMLKGLHNRGHAVTAGDSADKDIARPSRTGSTTLFGDEAGLHVREG